MSFPKLMPRSVTDDDTSALTSGLSSVLSAVDNVNNHVAANIENFGAAPPKTEDEMLDHLTTLLQSELSRSPLSSKALSAIRFENAKSDGYDHRQVDETMEHLENAAKTLFSQIEAYMSYVALSINALKEAVAANKAETFPVIQPQPAQEQFVQPAPEPERRVERSSSWSATEIAEVLLIANQTAKQIVADAEEEKKRILDSAKEEKRDIEKEIEDLSQTASDLEAIVNRWEEILQDKVKEIESAYNQFVQDSRHQLIDSMMRSIQPTLMAGYNDPDD